MRRILRMAARRISVYGAAKPGSLADKVGMVSRYNEVNDKRK